MGSIGFSFSCEAGSKRVICRPLHNTGPGSKTSCDSIELHEETQARGPIWQPARLYILSHIADRCKWSLKKESQNQVLNAWAEIDPIPLRGISPRVQSLAGKKIGVFANFKRAARPIALSIEKRLRRRC